LLLIVCLLTRKGQSNMKQNLIETSTGKHFWFLLNYFLNFIITSAFLDSQRSSLSSIVTVESLASSNTPSPLLQISLSCKKECVV
jgi:hypothetical protein